MESIPQTISSAPSLSSTLCISRTVSHVASAETELDVESTEEPQILNALERGTDVSLPSVLQPQLSDYQGSLEERQIGSTSQSRRSLDSAGNPEGVRLGVMEEPSRNTSPNLEPKLSKREKNRLKSLRRKQRKKERWIQRAQEAKDLVRCFKDMCGACLTHFVHICDFNRYQKKCGSIQNLRNGFVKFS